jgi:hypothetical protein
MARLILDMLNFLDTTVHEQHVCMLFNNARSMRQ